MWNRALVTIQSRYAPCHKWDKYCSKGVTGSRLTATRRNLKARSK